LEKNVQAAVKKLDCGNDEAAKEFKVQYYNLSFLENFAVVQDSAPKYNLLIIARMIPTTRFIVYELMPNVSLKSYLHGSGSSRGSATTITWPMSMKIALDIARDLKSSNILLDYFGLAVVNGPKKKNLKLSGKVGQLTEKSEVFAFGKKTVEKLGPGECETIITWAMLYLTDRTKLTNVIDPLLRHDGLETSLPGSSSGGFVRAARTEL
ncbi:hypothetical protein HID58_035303, partial [Brassica napus]